MQKIKVYSILNIYNLITCLHSLKEKSESTIIIDSLPAPYLSFIGLNENDGIFYFNFFFVSLFIFFFFLLFLGLCYMNYICSILKYICKNNSTVLVINLAIKLCDFTNKINDGICYQQVIGQTDYKPAIGKYWFHVPNTRLMLTTLLNAQEQICIDVVKSVYIPINEKCILTIDDSGVL